MPVIYQLTKSFKKKKCEVLLYDVIIMNLVWILVINFSFSKNLPHMPESILQLSRARKIYIYL